MLIEGVRLMMVGMATVFSFLSLLVVVMIVQARLFEAFGDRFEEPEVSPQPDHRTRSDDVEIAVVLAAIAAHRGRRA